MSDASRKAFVTALDAAYDHLQRTKKFDFSKYTQAEAEALFAGFLDVYTFEIMKTWDPKMMRTIGVPRNDQG